MRRSVITALAAAALVLAVTPTTQARTAPDTIAPQAAASSVLPHVVSPRIGYVYGGGVNSIYPGFGLTVYAQTADGALTRIQEVATDDSLHSLALVRIKTGRVLYALTRHQIFAYRVNAVTGLLTRFAVAQPKGPVSPVNGLAAYDPLAHGLPGQPMLVTGSCGTATLTFVCPFRYQTFLVDPATGALSGTLGPVGSSQLSTGIVGDGFGRFALGLNDASGNGWVNFAQAKLVAGKTVLAFAGSSELGDAAAGSPAASQAMGSAIVITRNHTVEFAVTPLHIFPDAPTGVSSYAFGASASLAEGRADALGTAAVQGVKLVYVGENAGTNYGPDCAIEAFGPVTPGSTGGATIVPCAGSPAFITSLFAQGTYVYAGRYGEQSLGFKDVGSVSMAPTGQRTVPAGTQIYSWAGFLFGDPTVSVPAKVSSKVGIPVTISCQQTCAGSTSAIIRIAGVPRALRVAVVAIKAHSAGTFTVRLLLSVPARAAVSAAIRKHHKVTATTTTKVVAGVHSVSVAKVSTLTA